MPGDTKIGDTKILAPATVPLAANERRVFVRDLVMNSSIGVHAHERGVPQRVRINLDLAVAEASHPIADDLRNVVCYDEIIGAVRSIVSAGHIHLLETLAERIAALCLADTRIRVADVRVEKLDVYTDVASVGVAIQRRSSHAPGC